MGWPHDFFDLGPYGEAIIFESSHLLCLDQSHAVMTSFTPTAPRSPPLFPPPHLQFSEGLHAPIQTSVHFLHAALFPNPLPGRPEPRAGAKRIRPSARHYLSSVEKGIGWPDLLPCENMSYGLLKTGPVLSTRLTAHEIDFPLAS